MNAIDVSTDSTGMLSSDFDERFAAFRPRLTAMCARIVGPTDAHDVVQEAYLRAGERVHQLRDPDLFETWVLRIALNHAKSIVRHQRLARDRAPLLVPRGGSGTDLGLRDLVEALPLRQRAVLVLHYGYGYRWAEVARLLGLSTINIRTLAFRARRALRRQLEEAEDA